MAFDFSARRAAASGRASAFLLGFLGLLAIAGGWLLPIYVKSLSPSLLRAAGRGTPSVGEWGLTLLDAEKPGPAQLVLDAARQLGDPRAGELEEALRASNARQPDLVPWGGWDPFLDPILNLKETAEAAGAVRDGKSVPVLTFFVTARARETLRSYLGNSRSQGVRAVLRLREGATTTRFVPATSAGGQPLDAVILLTALLYQGEHLSPALARQVRTLAETAAGRGEMGELETVFADLLSLGKRLDWIQLTELTKVAGDAATLGQFAHLARVAEDQMAILYTAALLTGSADRAAAYLIRYGKPGAEALRLALGARRGAVEQLLARQVPLAAHGPTLAPAAELALEFPKPALALKYGLFLLGAFLLFRACDAWLFSSRPAPDGRAAGEGMPQVRSGLLALMLTILMVAASEPSLVRAAPISEYRLRLVTPVLVPGTQQFQEVPVQTTFAMDTRTLLSIAIFAVLQIAVYLLCLVRIRDIDRSPVPSAVKLRLMENEENLFDSGLYVGIAGTATALVLQVLGLIQANLLAAYSSNLFGILCVALIKIRHVRSYKRRLILESQAASPAAPAAAVAR